MAPVCCWWLSRRFSPSQLVQPLPLRGEPLFEGGLPESQAGQQVSLVDVGDLLEPGGTAVSDQALEPRDIHVDDRGIQGYRRATQEQAGLDGFGKYLPDPGQGLAQVAPGLGIRNLPPQQAGNLLPRMGLARRDGQVGQQRLGLAAGQHHRRAGVGFCAEPS